MIDNDADIASSVPGADPSPPAGRLRRPRRFGAQTVAGALLVLVSVVVGARIVGAADDTEVVLAAAEDLRAGQPLTAELVSERHVELDGSTPLYVAGDVGDGYVVVRDVAAGELLPRSAVLPGAEVTGGRAALRYVTVTLPSGEAPTGLAAGHTVDVWITPADGAERRRARPLAAAVTVSAADAGAGALGSGGSQAAITLAVTADDAPGSAAGDATSGNAASHGDAASGEVSAGADTVLDDLVGELIAAGRDGRLYLTRVPGQD